jgi:glycosyltransferase involved in cell wall biosynthesis
MKIILGVDSVRYPLTGIGRYAWELACGLPHSETISDIRYYAFGRFKTRDELFCVNDDHADAIVKHKYNYLSKIRRHLSRSSIVSLAYGRIAPTVAAVRLKMFRGFLFHGPNFLLPSHGGPSVVTIHDLSVFQFPKWHPKTRVKRLNDQISSTLKRAAHIITDSEYIRDEIIEYFSWPKDRISSVPLGVSERFFPRTSADIQITLNRFGLKAGTYTLCVATIEPRKNIERLIVAYKSLPKSIRSAFPLVLTGDYGWNSEHIHQMIIDGQQQGFIRYLGYVSDDCLSELYSGCRAFLYPSLYEGFGLPILEAMASGVPVLTSNCSSLPGVAAGAGLLVAPEDVSAIALGIEKVITDEQWRISAIQRGLIRARQMTWQACVNKTIDVYKQVWGN